MAIKAVIFDFNGTLFRDTDFHNEAWTTFASRYGIRLSDEDLKKHIHGFTNKEILFFLFKKELSKDLLEKFYEEKEEIYRAICQVNPESCNLSPGSELFLDYLHENKIKKTIATASYPKNVIFYNSMFNLERWFDMNLVIQDTGHYRGKPFPDMFLAAANTLSVPIKDCMVIEDSIGGINAAKNSKAGRIIAISPENDIGKFGQFVFLDQIVTDFCQIDRTCFIN
jgi:beta-phosphoglucomutase